MVALGLVCCAAFFTIIIFIGIWAGPVASLGAIVVVYVFWECILWEWLLMVAPGAVYICRLPFFPEQCVFQSTGFLVGAVHARHLRFCERLTRCV